MYVYFNSLLFGYRPSVHALLTLGKTLCILVECCATSLAIKKMVNVSDFQLSKMMTNAHCVNGGISWFGCKADNTFAIHIIYTYISVGCVSQNCLKLSFEV